MNKIFLKVNVFALMIFVSLFLDFSFSFPAQAGSNDCQSPGDQCTGSSISCDKINKERKSWGDLDCTSPTTPLCCQNKSATCASPDLCQPSCSAGTGEVDKGQKDCGTGKKCCTPPPPPPVTVACTGSGENCKNVCLPVEAFIGTCGSAGSGKQCCKMDCLAAAGNCATSASTCAPGTTPRAELYCADGKTCCKATVNPPSCPGGACSTGACPADKPTASGACSAADGGGTCCKPASTGPASCPGGTCSTGACPADKPTASGACSAADGGGTCCKPAAAPPQTIKFENPLKFNTVEEVLGSLLGTLRGIIVVLALVFIVIGAVMYITSAGNEKQMTTAKGAILAAMIGLAIGIAAPSFLKQIGEVLGWGPINNSLPADTKTLTEIALNILKFLLSIVGVLGIIMLVIGGIMYLTAAGDEDRIDTGKKIVTYAIIGIFIALASLVIVTQIATLFV